jgi:Cdc6-like AAA superfamily ATPase
MNNTYYLNDLDISGVPGTGKTATVLEVIRGLQYRSEQDVEVCATLYSQWDETTNSFYE